MSEYTAELLAGAVVAFTDAVHALVGHRPDTITDDNTTRHIILDGRYTELTEARHAQHDTNGLRGVYKSKPPLWIDACSLLDQIDRTVHEWWPTPAPGDPRQPATIRRLHALTDHPWRPQDLPGLNVMTRIILGWVDRIDTLLPAEPLHTWELTAACPACGETTVLVEDEAGEMVRRAALRATKSSAVCQACDTNWAPEHFLGLAAAIGASLPDGVLE
ncbi:hypothetical protein IU443_28685 [Nocardia farcinica]|uniref:Uncharacterized protein n=2 Tax=Nocardia farcinica TaxID=37329 RepID=A0A0H5P8X2_NOCFR|nr:hypothetical protein [Nocardia farcinica]SLG33483.1 Uncharacterised protein [Mycobacteroides abscessus subsp. abscessus]AXK88583.1 hypothetical protein DXT66_25830 [Nocardia farcinica]MBF6393910.1 hypothetical protein [Nocardia farcinica]MBF6540727.1 hypothetical protein [Nocardia farcinica]PFW98892.1 hypothetical protein CJ469_05853 [Nocardia farcinica]